jgi:hypothetical protein
MNTTVTAERTALETARFFMIMGNLAAAKSAAHVEAVAEWIDELDAIAMHCPLAFIAERAKLEATAASSLLIELQTQRFGYAGPLIVMTRADVPANLN